MSEEMLFVVIFSGVWGLVGLIFLIIGFIMIKIRKRKEEKCTCKIFGKVKDITRRQTYSSDGYSSTLHPVFEYNIGGLTYVKESQTGSFQCKYAIGQDIEIFYNPNNPHEYYVVGEKLNKILRNIFSIVGGLCIFIAVISAIIVLNYFG